MHDLSKYTVPTSFVGIAVPTKVVGMLVVLALPTKVLGMLVVSERSIWTCTRHQEEDSWKGPKQNQRPWIKELEIL